MPSVGATGERKRQIEGPLGRQARHAAKERSGGERRRGRAQRIQDGRRARQKGRGITRLLTEDVQSSNGITRSVSSQWLTPINDVFMVQNDASETMTSSVPTAVDVSASKICKNSRSNWN